MYRERQWFSLKKIMWNNLRNVCAWEKVTWSKNGTSCVYKQHVIRLIHNYRHQLRGISGRVHRQVLARACAHLFVHTPPTVLFSRKSRANSYPTNRYSGAHPLQRRMTLCRADGRNYLASTATSLILVRNNRCIDFLIIDVSIYRYRTTEIFGLYYILRYKSIWCKNFTCAKSFHNVLKKCGNCLHFTCTI